MKSSVTTILLLSMRAQCRAVTAPMTIALSIFCSIFSGLLKYFRVDD